MERRSRSELEKRVDQAPSDTERASAHFDLAVFHDNNGRESEAIPHYEAALNLGVAGELRAQCLAWLASSLSKTDRNEEALQRIPQALELTQDQTLSRFLHSLERRTRVGIAMSNARDTRR